MKSKKGWPILGAVLGGLGALVLILILMLGAIVPPTQFVVWGLLGLGVLLGSSLLTVVKKSGTFISIVVISVAMLAWSGLGFSAHNAHGDLTGGCELTARSFDEGGATLDTATPRQTSVADPFALDPSGTIEWVGTTPGAFEGWSGWLAVDVAGFTIRVWDGGHGTPGRAPQVGGTVDVGSPVGDIEDAIGIQLSGVVHSLGNITSPEGACDMNAYVKLPSEGLFTGPVLIVLWGVFGIIAIVLLALAIPALRRRRRLRATVAPLGGAAAAAAATDKALDEADTARAAAETPPPPEPESTEPVVKKAAAKKAPAKKAPAKKTPAKKTPPKEG